MRKGRFQQAPSSLLKTYSESVSFDWRLYRHDIRGSIAHARALRNAGVLAEHEFESIEKGLLEIEEEIASGRFRFDPELEDVHMNIEAELTRRIGDAGGKLHTARSRNDQVALDLRLYLRDEIADSLRFGRSFSEGPCRAGAQACRRGDARIYPPAAGTACVCRPSFACLCGDGCA